jgi:uncharacterized protein (TIGR02301 family)
MRQLLIALWMLAAAPAAAQDRAPPARQGLVDLSYTLGQAHGLALTCSPDSQTWRLRMIRLVEVETPDEVFRARLFDAFNTGFSTAQARHPRCGRRTRSELATVARRGQDLARVIASAR